MTDPTRRPKPAAGSPAQRPAQTKPQSAGAARPAAAPARAAAQPARPAPQPAPRAAARVAAPAPDDEPAPVRRPARRDGPRGDEALDPTTKKGLIAAGVMVVIASVVWIVIHNKQAKEEGDRLAVVKMVQDFKTDIL